MLKDQHIICVSSTSWKSNFLQSIVQHISLLAKDNKVLFVDYPFTWTDILRRIFQGKFGETLHILGLGNRIKKEKTEFDTELFVLTLPPVFPINWISNEKIYDFLNRINYKIVLWSIQKAIKKLELTSPVYINSWNPFFGINYKVEFNDILQIYFCYDEMSASNWMKKHGVRLEKRYLPLADLVVTTSKELKNTKSKINPNCYIVPNGVNFSVFNGYLNVHHHEKVIEKKGYKHIIGYIGTIDERLDVALLHHTMGLLSDFLFVFIGRITAPSTKSKLEAFHNTLFISPLSLHELPKYVNDFSACIIPFVKNEFTMNVYPMKINEYLSMGKPVVLTDFSDLQEFQDICSITTSPSDFAQALVAEIAQDSPSKIKERISVSAQNSWEKRSEAFSEIMERQLQSSPVVSR
jgi:glycosyltransferase involved in cell wall biosynthesis